MQKFITQPSNFIRACFKRIVLPIINKHVWQKLAFTGKLKKEIEEDEVITGLTTIWKSRKNMTRN